MAMRSYTGSMNEGNGLLFVAIIAQVSAAAGCFSARVWGGGIAFGLSAIFTGYLICRNWENHDD
jgi:hypothetical protein